MEQYKKPIEVSIYEFFNTVDVSSPTSSQAIPGGIRSLYDNDGYEDSILDNRLMVKTRYYLYKTVH